MTGATRAERGKLGGLRHRQVVRLLAAAEISQTEIARRFDVSQPAVSQFASKHAEEIAAVRADMDNEFAGIAIASKVNRVRLLQEIAEKAMEPTPKITNKGTLAMAPDADGQLQIIHEFDGRLAAQAAKQVAEEMGQLTTRTQVSGDMNTTTTYRIEGVAPEDLK